MSTNPLLLIHAGMRPGEIVIARADGSTPVFVPPTDSIHVFVVGKNQEKEEWALLRQYSDRAQPDVLISFPTADEAEQALGELHRALLEPAPVVADKSSTLRHRHLPLAAALALLAIVSIFLFTRTDTDTGGDTAATSQVAGTEFLSPATGSQIQQPEVSSPVAPSTSPGDDILRQIQQTVPPSPPVPATTPPATAAPQAPASTSPGDSLLQQIKGG